MFSMAEKQKLSADIEKLLLDLKHPEMPTEKLKFRLHVDGSQSWSWADIEPNWTFNDANKPSVNQFNEKARDIMDPQA